MAHLKKLLAMHVEKLVLGLILVLAAYSMLSNLFRETKTTGEGELITPSVIAGQMERIETHLRSSIRQAEPPPIPSAHMTVIEIRNAPVEEAWKAEGQDAIAYAILPKPLSAPKPVAAPTSQELPPMEYWSTIAAPTAPEVWVGGKRIAVLWSTPPECRRVRNVRALILRTTVGEGKPGAQPSLVSKPADNASSPMTPKAGLNIGGAVPPSGEPGGGYNLDALTHAKPQVVISAAPGAALPPEALPPADAPALPQPPAQIEAERFAAQEKAVAAQLEGMLNKQVVFQQPWKLLKADITGLTTKPAVEELLEGRAPATATAVDAVPSALQPLWFYFVDEDIDENTIYRYKVLFFANPVPLPKDLREKEEYSEWAEYVRIGADSAAPLGPDRLSLSKEEVIAQIKAANQKGTEPGQLVFPPLEARTLTRKDGTAIQYYGLPEEVRRSTERLKALEGRESYSPFSYSDYILSPVRSQILFTSRINPGTPNDTAMIKVLMIDAFGLQHEQTFLVKKPAFVAPEGTFPNPYEYYVKAGFPETIKPAPIGESRKVNLPSGEKVQIDFSTSWGLADIRECRTVVKRFESRQKKNPQGYPVVDANGNPVMEDQLVGTPLELDSDYIVLWELQPKEGEQPRVKGIPRFRAQPPPPLREEVTIKE